MISDKLIVSSITSNCTGSHREHCGSWKNVESTSCVDWRWIIMRLIKEEAMRDAVWSQSCGLLLECSNTISSISEKLEFQFSEFFEKPRQPINESSLLMTVMSRLCLSDQRRDSQPIHKHVIGLLTSSKQLGKDVDIWSNLPCAYQQLLRNMDRSSVSIVDSESVENTSRFLKIEPNQSRTQRPPPPIRPIHRRQLPVTPRVSIHRRQLPVTPRVSIHRRQLPLTPRTTPHRRRLPISQPRYSEERVHRGHGSEVRCIDWHPTKGLLVTGSRDTQQPVKIWDPKSGSCLATLQEHKSSVMAVEFNRNGNWQLTGGRDHLVKMYDIRMMKEVKTYRAHKKEVISLAWPPIHDGRFVSGGGDGSSVYWMVDGEKEIGLLERAHDQAIWSMKWHPLGHILATGSNDNNTKFWARNRPGDTAEDIFGLSNITMIGHSDKEREPRMAPQLNRDVHMTDSTLLVPDDLTRQNMGPLIRAKRKLIEQPPAKKAQRQFERMWNNSNGIDAGTDDFSAMIGGEDVAEHSMPPHGGPSYMGPPSKKLKCQEYHGVPPPPPQQQPWRHQGPPFNGPPDRRMGPGGPWMGGPPRGPPPPQRPMPPPPSSDIDYRGGGHPPPNHQGPPGPPHPQHLQHHPSNGPVDVDLRSLGPPQHPHQNSQDNWRMPGREQGPPPSMNMHRMDPRRDPRMGGRNDDLSPTGVSPPSPSQQGGRNLGPNRRMLPRPPAGRGRDRYQPYPSRTREL